MKKDDNENIGSANSSDINLFQKNSSSIIIKKLKKLYQNYSNSKWSNLKFFLQDKKSLKTSIDLMKTKTIEQFSSKCIEIYKKKLQIQLITQKNREMFKYIPFNNNQNNYINSQDSIKGEFNLTKDEIISQLKIKEIKDQNINGLNIQAIRDFFFEFREDNNLMMRLIECIDTDQFEIIVPFLCHFFYENFYIENNEQEEILYIIYLLLEKEIDSLYTPSVSTFLDKSFVSMFLSEIGNRYEIKHYIDIILNYLIRNIEEINISFYSLNIEEKKNSKQLKQLIIKSSKHINYDNKLFNKKIDFDLYGRKTYGVLYNVENSTFTGGMSIGNIIKRKNLFEEEDLNKILNTNETKSNMKEIFKKELYNNAFFNINEKYLRDKFEKEENDIMRHFYMRLLRQINSASNPDLYNTNKYFENLIYKNKNISPDILEDFNKGYFLVTKFISELLDNLENNNKIMPYSIKVICKFIFTLLTKKFKNISKIQCNLLVNRFLFDKLILPVIQNPDINDTGKNMIITLNTRKNLYYVYQVLKMLIRGELFNTQQYSYMTVFNSFIMNNFGRLSKIMENLLKVNAPKKLLKLSEEFYKDEQFNLDEIIREGQSVNYDYFKENPHDFMSHKSICFSIKELKLFYSIVNNNKERFIQGEKLEKIFKNLSEIMSLIKFKQYEYYVIIRDNYNEEVNELLSLNEHKIILGKAKNKEDIFNNLKYCISYLISKLDIFPNWVWVTENFDTEKTFEYINTYLNTYFKYKNKFVNSLIPLNWYSSYIINNLKYLEKKYCLNDYQLLYDSLESEIISQIKKARNLNKFLTINMTTKNFLIDHKIKIYENELDNVKSTELNIKAVQFIESAKIDVCLTNYSELNDMIKYLNTSLDLNCQNSPYILLISKESECIHHQKMEKKTYKKLKDNILRSFHCTNINEFTEHLSDYNYLIGQDILDSYKTNAQKNNEADNGDKLKEKKKGNNEINQISKQTMIKNILEEYKKYVIESMNESNLFNLKNYQNNNDNDEKKENEYNYLDEEKKRELLAKYEDDKNKSLKIISDYILKKLSIKIYDAELDKEDELFKNTCIKLNWISHKNLEINDNVFNKNLFNKVIEHVKKMDYMRTPSGMLYEFGLGVQLINSMFIFMLNQMQAEAGELLPLIIYSIIATKPEKIIFNIKFIKFFMNQNELLGNIGYNLIQCESSIRYINSLNEKQLKMDKQEFDDRCKLSLLKYEVENKKKDNIKKVESNKGFKNI